MERIKQALEKAREQRQGQQPAATPRATAQQAPGAPDQISYHQTRNLKVPREALRRNRILGGVDDKSFVESFKILRTQVLQRLRENDWNVLAVTSPDEDAGKTVTAINLAASLAMEISYTVLLVDADLRHPDMLQHLGLPPAKGLADYLLDDVPVPDLLVKPDAFEHVVILPGGRPVAHSAELLNSPKMADLVEELKTRYPRRIVIFDLPPVLSAADALAFAPYVDAALLVIEDGGTKQEDLQRAVELLDCTNIIGTVLNKAAGTSAGY